MAALECGQADQEKAARFLQWLQENGAHLRGCTLKACSEDLDAGLGVYTTDTQTPEDGVLMVTPLDLAITPMGVLQDPVLGSVFAKLFEGGDVDDRLVVILFLLVEGLRGEQSFWAPYLKMLPTQFGTTLCFTEEELVELKGTALYKATKIQQMSLKRHFHEKLKGLAETILKAVGWVQREVEFEDFLWANAVFWTRALNVPCPRAILFPKAWSRPHEKQQEGVDAVVQVSRLKVGSPETLVNSPPLNSSRDQHPMDLVLGSKHGGEVGAMPDESLAGDTVIVKTIEKDGEEGSFGQLSSDMDSSGMPETEAPIWVEGLVPGLDFCNHATRAAAVWEVDDEKGTASGVKHYVYLVTAPEIGLQSNAEVRINYGNKGNEELLFLYGFVVDDNPDDYLMIHFPQEALESSVCSDAKLLLLEEQKLPMRWLLRLSLLNDGNVCGENSEGASPTSDTRTQSRASQTYSWSGHRKAPPDLVRQVFPEEMMGALRVIAMTEDEVRGTTALLEELSDPGEGHVPSSEDIRAAVWEVCGDAGALQLLHDLLTAKILEIEEGTGPEELDAELLSSDAQARREEESRGPLGEERLSKASRLSRNKRACVVYRKGQKLMVRRFLQEAEHALSMWIA